MKICQYPLVMMCIISSLLLPAHAIEQLSDEELQSTQIDSGLSPTITLSKETLGKLGKDKQGQSRKRESGQIAKQSHDTQKGKVSSSHSQHTDLHYDSHTDNVAHPNELAEQGIDSELHRYHRAQHIIQSPNIAAFDSSQTPQPTDAASPVNFNDLNLQNLTPAQTQLLNQNADVINQGLQPFNLRLDPSQLTPTPSNSTPTASTLFQ